MKLNKDDIRILLKGLLINTFSVMEFKEPELRLPKYPMSFKALAESLEIKRTNDALQMTEFLKKTKTPAPVAHVQFCRDTVGTEPPAESEILDVADGDTGHRKRKIDQSQTSLQSDYKFTSPRSEGSAGCNKRRRDEEMSPDTSELNVITDFLSDEDTDVMIDNLNRCMEKNNIYQLKKVVQQSESENDLATGFGIHLISKLTGNTSVSTELCEEIRCPCGCNEKLEGNSNMWIGSEEIWHGEVDMLAGNKVKGENLVACTIQILDETDEVDPDEDTFLNHNISSVIGVTEEMKLCYSADKMNRFVAQSVVFAFTQYNRHRDLCRLIPSVLLSPTNFQVLIYDPVDDLMFRSNKFYFSFNENDCRPWFILWIILNYRTFFQMKLSPSLNISCSGFGRTMKSCPEKFSIFEKMNSYNAQIIVEKNRSDTGHAVYPNEMIYRDCYIQVKGRCSSESN